MNSSLNNQHGFAVGVGLMSIANFIAFYVLNARYLVDDQTDYASLKLSNLLSKKKVSNCQITSFM